MLRSDQLPVSTKFDMPQRPGSRQELRAPAGRHGCGSARRHCVFFVSYSYMDSIINTWNEMNILKVRPLHEHHQRRKHQERDVRHKGSSNVLVLWGTEILLGCSLFLALGTAPWHGHSGPALCSMPRPAMLGLVLQESWQAEVALHRDTRCGGDHARSRQLSSCL